MSVVLGAHQEAEIQPCKTHLPLDSDCSHQKISVDLEEHVASG